MRHLIQPLALCAIRPFGRLPELPSPLALTLSAVAFGPTLVQTHICSNVTWSLSRSPPLLPTLDPLVCPSWSACALWWLPLPSKVIFTWLPFALISLTARHFCSPRCLAQIPLMQVSPIIPVAGTHCPLLASMGICIYPHIPPQTHNSTNL